MEVKEEVPAQPDARTLAALSLSHSSLSLSSSTPHTVHLITYIAPLKDDPKYAYFFKMMKLGVRKEELTKRAEAQGLDPVFLEYATLFTPPLSFVLTLIIS